MPLFDPFCILLACWHRNMSQSTDSFSSRASTGRIHLPRRLLLSSSSSTTAALPIRRSNSFSQPQPQPQPQPQAQAQAQAQEIRRCPWITASTEPCYVAFHDEEWGVPVHDDKRLFELFVLSGALAELTWPSILSRRRVFREVFMDFEPLLVSRINEKRLIAAGSCGTSLLSETKLRGTVENAREMLKIVDQFGSFDRYIWGFVNNSPIVGWLRYQRQVPVRTSKADLISKDLVRRGFRGVGPTVIYSFMQVCGLTNDHLVSCYRFDECNSSSIIENGISTGSGSSIPSSGNTIATTELED